VHDHLCHAAGMKTDGGMLCIGCLERRPERLLTPDDFRAAPIHTNPRASR
jgi:hypothetical protein